MCGLLCAGNSSERKRKRLENQAQVGCQEDLRNRKTENEKTGEWGTSAFKAREFLFHRVGGIRSPADWQKNIFYMESYFSYIRVCYFKENWLES